MKTKPNPRSPLALLVILTLCAHLLPASALAFTSAAGPNSPYATNPNPADGEIIDAVLIVLAWQPGAYAVRHDLYFSTNFDDVNDCNPGAFRRTMTTTAELVIGLIRGQTYYWRVNEVNEAHPDSPWYGPVWHFKVRGYKATNPNPPDGAQNVSLDPLLEWEPGTGAAIHYVYFGTGYDPILNATTSSPQFRGYVGAPDCNWSPVHDGGLTLDYGTEYSWRIDETPDGVTMYKGDVWTFTTAPEPGSPYATNPYPADGEIIDAVLIVLAWQPGAYAVRHDLYFSTNFDDVNDCNPGAFRRTMTTTAELVIGLIRGQTYYWRVNEVNDTHPDSPWYGEVWHFKVRGYKATNPNPPDGAQNVSLDPLLEWEPGTGAAIHYVYFGADYNGVQNATTDDPEFREYVGATDSNWAPVGEGGLTLDYHTDYYWRIDETPDGVTMYKGDVWTFATALSSQNIYDFTWVMKAPMHQSRSDCASVALNGKIYAIGGYVGGHDGTAAVEEYDPVTDTWTHKAPISNAVWGLRAAAVNGKIYVFGGANNPGGNSQWFSTVQEYDPSTNTWTAKSPMSQAKYRVAIGVFNDRIYIIGGTHGDVAFDTIEEYNPLTDMWTTKTPMPFCRHILTSTQLGNEIYLVVYPLGGPTYVYDMATESWSQTAAPPMDNVGCPATAAMNGKIYTFGGSYTWGSSGPVGIPDVWEYDPSTEAWSPKTPMVTGAAHYPAAAVLDNKVYVLGGQTAYPTQSTTLVQQGTLGLAPIQWPLADGGNGHYYQLVYDPCGILWADARLAAEQCTYMGAYGYLATITSPEESSFITNWLSQLKPQYYIMVGGYQDHNAPDYSEPAGGWRWVTGELWDYTNWHTGEPSNGGPTHGEDVLGLKERHGFFWNDGYAESPEHHYIVEYPAPLPENPFIWTRIADLPGDQHVACAAVIDGKVYMVGGQNPSGPPNYNKMRIYDPATNSWSDGPPMPTRRYCPGAGVIDYEDHKELYVVGGYSGYAGLSTVERYIPAEGIWQSVASVTGNRGHGIMTAVVNNNLYAIGGFYNGLTYFATNEMYDRRNNTWMLKTPITRNGQPLPMQAGQIAALNDKIYIFGGTDSSGALMSTLIYDTLTDTWSQGADIPRVRVWGGAVTFAGRIYFIGGADGSNIIDVYDPVSDSWSTIPDYPGSNTYCPVIAQSGNCVYVLADSWQRPGYLECWRGIFATRILYADTDAPGANDGSSWANAFNYLQDALMFASAGDEIRVAQGVYRPDQFVWSDRPNLGRAETFQLKNGVAIKGGYAGYGEPNEDTRDIELYETILSGDLNGDDGLAPHGGKNDNCFHVVTVPDTCKAALLDGFTVTGGNAVSSSPMYERGGGIYCLGEVAVVNCKVSGNDAVCGGGMCSDSNSSPTLTDCTFSENDAYHGGGMYNESAKPTVTKCTFSNNSAEYGGGIYCSDSSPTIADCDISHNTSYLGGGIYCDASSPTIADCNISSNETEDGGGIRCLNNSSPIITRCTFNTNIVGGGGGGAICCRVFSSPTITGCTMSNNEDYGGGGGAIFCRDSSSPDIANCIITGNMAIGGGGGIRCENSSSPTITNCTFSGNTATFRSGGAIQCESSSSPTVVNCILWADTVYGSPNEINCYGGSAIKITYSDIQGGWPGEGNIHVEPCFADPCSGDYHLKSQAGRWESATQAWAMDDVTSPCIDAGDPHDDVGDEPDPNGGRINMGAYGGTAEASKSHPCFSVGMVDACGQKITQLDYDLWLSLARPKCWCYPCHCRGDCNGDCRLNAIDVLALRSAWPGLGGMYNPCADINYDGVISAIDVLVLRGAWPGLGGMGCSDVPGCK